MTLTPLSHKCDICVYLEGPLLLVTANFMLFHRELGFMAWVVLASRRPGWDHRRPPPATLEGTIWAWIAHHVCASRTPGGSWKWGDTYPRYPILIAKWANTAGALILRLREPWLTVSVFCSSNPQNTLTWGFSWLSLSWSPWSASSSLSKSSWSRDAVR